MSKLTHEANVKEVGGNDDFLCIELFNGLRLVGPLRTNPIPREPVAPVTEPGEREQRELLGPLRAA